ncbi:MAG: YtxH domain-containing protein [Janthinobacterium lividum]
MPKDNGKVIVSLLVGATAGIVAGLLLAPETGEETRNGVRDSATKWGSSLGSLLKGTLAKLQGDPHTNPDAAVSEDRTAADALFNSMSEPGDLSTPATGNGRTIAGDSDVEANQGHDDGSGDGRTSAM